MRRVDEFEEQKTRRGQKRWYKMKMNQPKSNEKSKPVYKGSNTINAAIRTKNSSLGRRPTCTTRIHIPHDTLCGDENYTSGSGLPPGSKVRNPALNKIRENSDITREQRKVVPKARLLLEWESTISYQIFGMFRDCYGGSVLLAFLAAASSRLTRLYMPA